MFNKNMFRAQMALRGITARELSEKLGINESTLYRKINADGSFTREEINQLILILDISDPRAIFFSDELA